MSDAQPTRTFAQEVVQTAAEKAKAESVGEPPRAEPLQSDAELAGELAGYVLGKAKDRLGLRGCEIDMDQETYHMEEMLAEIRREFHLPTADELPISQENKQFLKDTILPAMRRKAGSRLFAPTETVTPFLEVKWDAPAPPQFSDLENAAIRDLAQRLGVSEFKVLQMAVREYQLKVVGVPDLGDKAGLAPSGEPKRETCRCGAAIYRNRCYNCGELLRSSPVGLQDAAVTDSIASAAAKEIWNFVNENPMIIPAEHYYADIFKKHLTAAVREGR